MLKSEGYVSRYIRVVFKSYYSKEILKIKLFDTSVNIIGIVSSLFSRLGSFESVKYEVLKNIGSV